MFKILVLLMPVSMSVLVVLLGTEMVAESVVAGETLACLLGALTCKGVVMKSHPKGGGSGLRPGILVLVFAQTAGVGLERKAVMTTRTLARGDALWSRAVALLVKFWWPLTAGVGLEGAVKGAARGPAVRSPSPVTLDIMMGSIGLVRGGVLRCVLR